MCINSDSSRPFGNRTLFKQSCNYTGQKGFQR
jgi:hypothetical protein